MRHPWQSAGLLATVAVAAAVGVGATALPSHAGIAFDIHLSSGGPRLLAVPGVPVYYVDGYDCDVYRYGGWNYAYDDGCWYRTQRYGGPWVSVAVAYVPRVVRTCYSRGYYEGGYYGGGYSRGSSCDDDYYGGTRYCEPSRRVVYRQQPVVYQERVYVSKHNKHHGNRGNGRGHGRGNGRGAWWGWDD